MKTTQELKNYEILIASLESTTIADRVSARLNRFRFFAESKANEMDETAKETINFYNAKRMENK